jgi:hypothetical protein
MKRGSDSVRSNSICAFEPRERRRNQATATPSISIFQAGLARPPTIRVLAGLRSPSALLRASRAAATSPGLGRMVVTLTRLRTY